MKFRFLTIGLIAMIFSMQGEAATRRGVEIAGKMSEFLNQELSCRGIDNAEDGEVFTLRNVTPRGLIGNNRYELQSNEYDYKVKVSYVDSNDEEIRLKALNDSAMEVEITCSKN